MNIRLKPEIQKYVKKKVRSGQYASPEEAVNTLLAHACRQEELTAEDKEELAAEIDLGISQADRGQFTKFTAEQIIAQRHKSRSAPKKAR
jgi:Arc/MetJ-type ribon-helix-helix transcriptional regulator